MRTGETCFRGDVGEGAVALVVKELVSSDVREEDVGPPVVVVIADGDSHAITGAGNAGALSHVGKRTVVVVAIEPVPVHGRIFLQGRNCCAIHQVNIQIAVAIVVEQRDPRDHGLDLILVCSG